MYNLFNRTNETVVRQVYTGDVSAPATISLVFKYYLKPLSNEQAVVDDRFQKDYRLTCNYNVDLQEWDILTIDWKKYSVKWVSSTMWQTLKYKKAILTEKQWS